MWDLKHPLMSTYVLLLEYFHGVLVQQLLWKLKVPLVNLHFFLWWINRMNRGILYNWIWISFQRKPPIHHVYSFLFFLFFNDFLRSLLPSWFSSSVTYIPHHHNDQFNIVCFCCSSITSFQTLYLLYNYWSFKVLQSSFSIVHNSHQNNDEWENLPLVLLNNKQMKVISTISMKWHWSLIS